MSNTPNFRHQRARGAAARRLKEHRLTGPHGKPSSPNDCWKPSSPQTKADLADLHDDQMRERRANYHKGKAGPDKARVYNARFSKGFDSSWKQQNVAWRTKSIWPDGKVAQPGRMG